MATAPSTTYTASTAFHVYTSGQFLTTQTYTLQPQTTPFVPPSGCTSELFCSMSAGEVSGGRVCYEYDSITSTGSAYISGTCFPDGYKDIFNHGATFSDAVTLAYPGDTCPTGWHAQCTRAVLSATGSTSATIIQTWCCPSGFTECQATLDARNCVRYTSNNVPMWIMREGSSTSNSNREFITKSLAGGDTLTVLKAGFPLVGARAATAASSDLTSVITNVPQSSGGNSGPGSDTTTTDGGGGAIETGASGSSDLSTGAIAGIAVGSIAGVALLAALGFFFFLRRRRSAAAAATHSPVSQGPPGPYDPASSTAAYPPSSTAYDPHSTWYSKDFPHGQQYPPGSVYDPHASAMVAPDGTYYGVGIKSELPAQPVQTAELDSSQVAMHGGGMMPMGGGSPHGSGGPQPVEIDSGTPAGQLHPNSFAARPPMTPGSPSAVSSSVPGSVPNSANPMMPSPQFSHASPQPSFQRL